jgi:cell division protein FtsI/penicillin-binding protein 2
VTQQTLDVVRTGLAAVVSRGTGTALQMPGLTAAGKTGTAEASHGKPYAWFAAYAPVDAPRLVVVAMVENAGFGAENALPVVKDVFQAWLRETQSSAAPASAAPSGGASSSAPAPTPTSGPTAGPVPVASAGPREKGPP